MALHKHEVDKKLRVSEKLYRAIFDNSIDAVMLTAPDGSILAVNPAACRFYGGTEDEIIKAGRADFMDTADPRLPVLLEKLEKTGRASGELRIKRKDGALFDAEISFSVFPDSEGNLMSSIISRAITEQKTLEEKLKSLTREQAIILENSSMGIAFLKEREIVWVNGNMEHILGYTKEELTGKETRLIYASAEEYERVGREAYPHLSREDVYEGEAMFRRKDGALLWVRLCGKVINPSDPSAGSIWIAEDITERKKIEEEREQMLIQQSRMAAMGEMIGAIGHQWRQPLNVLGLIVQSLKDAYDYGELDSERMTTAVHETMAQVTFMSRTIDDFRNFMKPSKEKSSFDAKVAMGEIFSLLSAQMKSNYISYTITCHVHNRTWASFQEIISCGEFEITSYKNEFKQVILNLISNAKDAILERRKKGLMVDDEEGRIAADFYRNGERIIIAISDNGGGIPEENIERIFDPHFTTKEAGTGIGLYLAKTIIEKNMGGRLYAGNTDSGAKFTIELMA
jgi:PAS domain S-box-containing protein